MHAAIFRPSHLKTTLSFASNAGGIPASVDQDSLVYNALKRLQAGQGRCWRLPEHSVMHLFQTWKPAQQQIAVCRRCMPMAFVSCTKSTLTIAASHAPPYCLYTATKFQDSLIQHTHTTCNKLQQRSSRTGTVLHLCFMVSSELTDIQHLVPIAYAGMPHDLAQTECLGESV